MIKKFLIKNWLLVLILLIGAFLRFYHLGDYMEFLGDQGRDVLVIRDFFKHQDLFFIGPRTSIGDMYLGPYFYYLIAPSLLLANFNPVGPAVFIALLNLVTIVLIYLIAQKWFNRQVGLMAAFLFTISPVVIKYSNFIWNPNIMPLFSLLFIYFFFEAIIRQKYKYFLYASLSFVMVINSHYLGLALLPLPGIYWLLTFIKHFKVKSKQLRPFLTNSLLAVLIFIISLTPQVLFDFKHDGQNLKALIRFFTYRENTVSIKPYKAIPELPLIFNQVNSSLLAAENLSTGLIISITFALLIGAYFLFTKKNKTYFWVIFGWYLLGLSALALYKQHLYNHYFAFLFPVVFILIAVLIHRFKYLGIPLFLFISFISLTNHPFRWSPNHQMATVQKITQSIITESDNQKYNFALLAKQNYDDPYRYFLTQTDETKLVSLNQQVTDQLFVVCEPFQMDCYPINHPEWGVAAFGWAEIDKEWEIDGIKIYKLIHPQTIK